MSAQPGILRPPLPLARGLTFSLAPAASPRPALERFGRSFPVSNGVVGLGPALAAGVAGLRPFPPLKGPGGSAPSTQQALWVWLQAADHTRLFDATEEVKALLGEAFVLEDALDTFVYAGGRDLTGYEDGTENPKGEAAEAAALRLDGSGFVAVQRWVHDLARFKQLEPAQRDATIGRQRESNEELKDAPPSAHVKRTAQESYDPPTFMLRRSMPWAGTHQQGLEFIAFVESLDRFERQLRRMLGLEDQISDALFTFSKPVTGSYYWCPPVKGDRLDLSALG